MKELIIHVPDDFNDDGFVEAIEEIIKAVKDDKGYMYVTHSCDPRKDDPDRYSVIMMKANADDPTLAKRWLMIQFDKFWKMIK